LQPNDLNIIIYSDAKLTEVDTTIVIFTPLLILISKSTKCPVMSVLCEIYVRPPNIEVAYTKPLLIYVAEGSKVSNSNEIN
jgi:hypothetical protein